MDITRPGVEDENERMSGMRTREWMKELHWEVRSQSDHLT